MKHLLIVGYFLVASLFTFLVVKAAAVIKMDKVDIFYQKESHTLSNAEVLEGGFLRVPGRKVVHYIETTETRNKKIFGWSTKIDTTKSYFMDEDDK